MDWLYTFYYLFIKKGFVSGLVSGGIQFGIAYGMYAHSKHAVTLWTLPNSLAGDCAVSLFIQVCITWLVEEIMVGWDCYKSNNTMCQLPEYLIPNRPDKITNRFIFAFYDFDKGCLPAEDNLSKKPSFREFLKKNFICYDSRWVVTNICIWLIKKLTRAVPFSVLLFIPVWPATLGISTSVGTPSGVNGYYFNHFPTPQILKLIYGFVIGITTSPVSSVVIIRRNYWYYIENKASDINRLDKEQLQHLESFPDTSQESSDAAGIIPENEIA